MSPLASTRATQVVAVAGGVPSVYPETRASPFGSRAIDVPKSVPVVPIFTSFSCWPKSESLSTQASPAPDAPLAVVPTPRSPPVG